MFFECNRLTCSNVLCRDQSNRSQRPMDLELEQGLRSIADLIQRKVINKSTPLEDDENLADELKLQHALVTCPKEWSGDIERVLFTESQIQARVKAMALEISRDYENKSVLAVGILTGAMCFMTDLLKYLLIPYTIDFMMLSSYGHGTVSSGSVVLKKDLTFDPSGKHILIIEDLIDTGGTLKWLKNYLSSKNCASIRLCTLLDKKARRTHEDVCVDYSGFHCPDDFVIGYGMDYAEKYRCLPFVGVLREEVYKPKFH